LVLEHDILTELSGYLISFINQALDLIKLRFDSHLLLLKCLLSFLFKLELLLLFLDSFFLFLLLSGHFLLHELELLLLQEKLLLLLFELFFVFLLFLGKHIALFECLILSFLECTHTLFVLLLLLGHLEFLFFKLLKLLIMKSLGLLSLLFKLIIVLFLELLSLLFSLLLLFSVLLLFLFELTVLDLLECCVPVHGLGILIDFFRGVVVNTQVVRAWYSLINFSRSFTFLELFFLLIGIRCKKTLFKHSFLDLNLKLLIF